MMNDFENFFQREWETGNCIEDEKPAMQRAWNAAKSAFAAPSPVSGADERAAFNEWFDKETLSDRMNGGQPHTYYAERAWMFRAALAPTPTGQQAALPLMRAAFRVTEAEGDPDPVKQRFHMRFTFRSLEELHAANDQWHSFLATAAPAPTPTPDGWMLVPKQRGSIPLADLIQMASLACIENRLMEDDDRRQLAQYADLIRNNGAPTTPTGQQTLSDEQILELAAPQKYLEPDEYGYDFSGLTLVKFARAILATAAPTEQQALSYTDGIEAAAMMLDKKADDYALEYGHDDMGAVSFGTGSHAQAKLEYHSTLIELAEEVRELIATAAPATADARDEVIAELRECLDCAQIYLQAYAKDRQESHLANSLIDRIDAAMQRSNEHKEP